jgi:hypothetical protein
VRRRPGSMPMMRITLVISDQYSDSPSLGAGGDRRCPTARRM